MPSEHAGVELCDIEFYDEPVNLEDTLSGLDDSYDHTGIYSLDDTVDEVPGLDGTLEEELGAFTGLQEQAINEILVAHDTDTGLTEFHASDRYAVYLNGTGPEEVL